jgi:hypothetical protein
MIMKNTTLQTSSKLTWNTADLLNSIREEADEKEILMLPLELFFPVSFPTSALADVGEREAKAFRTKSQEVKNDIETLTFNSAPLTSVTDSFSDRLKIRQR